MKKIVTLILLSAVMLTSAVTVRWTPNIEPDLSGYRVYWGTNSRSYTKVIDCGLTNVYFIDNTNFPTGVKFFICVTAYNATGLESEPSKELGFYLTNGTVVRFPSSVMNFRIQQ